MHFRWDRHPLRNSQGHSSLSPLVLVQASELASALALALASDQVLDRVSGQNTVRKYHSLRTLLYTSTTGSMFPSPLHMSCLQRERP